MRWIREGGENKGKRLDVMDGCELDNIEKSVYVVQSQVSIDIDFRSNLFDGSVLWYWRVEVEEEQEEEKYILQQHALDDKNSFNRKGMPGNDTGLVGIICKHVHCSQVMPCPHNFVTVG